MVFPFLSPAAHEDCTARDEGDPEGFSGRGDVSEQDSAPDGREAQVGGIEDTDDRRRGYPVGRRDRRGVF